MAAFPLLSNFQHDFVIQLVPVDTENTMDEVASLAASHSVGRRVAPQPDKILRVRRHGKADCFPRDMLVKDSGLKPTEAVDIIFADE